MPEPIEPKRILTPLSAARRALAVELRRAAALELDLETTKFALFDVHRSAGYQLAMALSAARRSWKDRLRLPMVLYRIARRHVTSEATPTPVPEMEGEALQLERAGDTRRIDREADVRRKPLFATIADEFTADGLAPEVGLLQLDPNDWRAQVAARRPDLLFVESAWRGSGGAWRGMLVPPSAELVEVLDWCATHAVPTVFWNKEDPVHFGYFVETAAHFDHVLTTDSTSVEDYRDCLGRDVGVLPFSVQPSHHHPFDTIERKDAFCFAGSYYRKYVQRQAEFRDIVAAAGSLRPVEIIDRNLGRNDPEFAFPDDLQPLVVGTLAPGDIGLAYKGYRYGINVNTVRDSPSMCARRVFELLASNTPVVSNPALAMDALFGPGVVVVQDGAEPTPRLREIVEDPVAYRKQRLAGLRKVMTDHTWARRVAQVCRVAGVASSGMRKANIVAVARVDTAAAWESVRDAVARQSRKPDSVWLLGDAASSIRSAATSLGFSWAGRLQDFATAIRGWEDCWVACMDAGDYHAPNYLLDLETARAYSTASAIGKAMFYEFDGTKVQSRHEDLGYRRNVALSPKRALLDVSMHSEAVLAALDGDAGASVPGDSVDEFNYCGNLATHGRDFDRWKAIVDA
jgi:spore maturation protein CgeB